MAKAIYVLLVPVPREAKDGAAESGCRSKGGFASLFGCSVSCASAVRFIRCAARLDSDQGGGTEGKVRSADTLLCAVPKNGRVWCKLGDPDSLRLKITPEEAQLAKFFRAVIAAEVRCQCI